MAFVLQRVRRLPLSGLGPAGRALHRRLLHVIFVSEEANDELRVECEAGDDLLEIAHNNDVDVEGACGGECACSTCHMILPQDIFDALPDPDEEEEDMLDLALGLQDTSRLGCQVVMTEAMDGARIVVPFDDFG